MSGYGFNWGGGTPQTPQGGYYNQMAQAMAGPSYAGPTPTASPSVGGKGALPEPGTASPQTPIYGAKGAQIPSAPRAVGTSPMARMRGLAFR